jgi:hypothetical protein
MSMVIDDVTAYQFTDHGTGNHVGREMLQSADASKADGRCESLRTEHN